MCETKPVTKMSVIGMSRLEISMTFFDLPSELSCQFRGFKPSWFYTQFATIKIFKIKYGIIKCPLHCEGNHMDLVILCVLLSCGFQGSSEVK